MEFFHKVTRFPFMQTRRVWYGLSAILILGSLLLVFIHGLNLGVDFTGGVVVETNFAQAPNVDSLRSALERAGVKGAQVQIFGGSRDILVRLPPDPNAKGEVIGSRILEVFHTVDPKATLQRTEVVGPQVGQELFVKAASRRPAPTGTWGSSRPPTGIRPCSDRRAARCGRVNTPRRYLPLRWNGLPSAGCGDPSRPTEATDRTPGPHGGDAALAR